MNKHLTKKQKLKLTIIKSALDIGISNSAKLFGRNRGTVGIWVREYKKNGIDSLSNKSRKKQYHPNKLSEQIVGNIIDLKKAEPSISAREIKIRLSLDCSITLINQKIRDFSTPKTDIQNKFSNSKITNSSFFVSIRESKNDNYENYPYEIIITHIQSKTEYMGFSEDKSTTSVKKFIKTFLKSLSDILNNQKRTIETIIFYSNITDFSNFTSDLIKKFKIYNLLFIKSSMKDKIPYNKKQENYFLNEKGDCFIRKQVNLFLNNYYFLSTYLESFVVENNKKLNCIITSKVIEELVYETNPIFIQKKADNPVLEATNIISLLYKKGEVFYKNFDFKDANYFYKPILDLISFSYRNNYEFDMTSFTNFKNINELKLSIKNNQAKILLSEGLLIEAENLLKSNLKNYSKLNDNYKILIYTNKLLALKYFNEGNLDKSVLFFKRALKVAKREKDKDETSSILLNIGTIHTESNIDLALKYFKKVIILTREIKKIPLRIKSLVNISGIYFRRGNYKKTISYLDEAYPLLNDEYNIGGDKDLETEIIILINYSASYRKIKKFELAEKFLNKAMNASKKLKLEKYIVEILIQQADLDEIRGFYREALVNNFDALENCKKNGYNKLYIQVLSNISSIYLDLESYKKADTYISKAILKAKNYPYLIPILYYNKAKYLYKIFKHKSSLKYLKKATNKIIDIKDAYESEKLKFKIKILQDEILLNQK